MANLKFRSVILSEAKNLRSSGTCGLPRFFSEIARSEPTAEILRFAQNDRLVSSQLVAEE